MKYIAFALALLSGCTFIAPDDSDGTPANPDDGSALIDPIDVDLDDCDDLRQVLQSLRTDIDAEIGDAWASRVSACRTLPIGTKACGGPAAYLVYSAEASNSDQLEALAAEHRRLDDARNSACRLVSTCDITPEPEVALEAGRCVPR